MENSSVVTTKKESTKKAERNTSHDWPQIPARCSRGVLRLHCVCQMRFLHAAFIVISCVSAVAADETAALRLRQTISLPGVSGRVDHSAADVFGERLFVCALGNNTLEVIDLRKGERVHSIGGFGE